MDSVKIAGKQEELESKIGYFFKDKELLKQALTHSSYANERKSGGLGDYERLEFLGDAVLELVSSDFLYHNNPDMPEGKLTKKRASMVCEPALAECARDIELQKYILLGKGEEQTGGRDRDSIISDVMEALIGAIYLDGGIEAARKHILHFILEDLKEGVPFKDSKTILQEIIQANGYESFCYRLAGEKGPDHDKTFISEVVLNGEVIGKGEGRSKKAAEQMAAKEAIEKLGGIS